MHKYKNISDMTQSLNGYGIAEPGEEIVVDHAIENPNFKYIGEAGENEGAKVIGVVEPQANVVTEGQFVEQPNNQETN